MLNKFKSFCSRFYTKVVSIDSIFMKNKVYQVALCVFVLFLFGAFFDSFYTDTIYRNYKSNSIREVQIASGSNYVFSFEAKSEVLSSFRVFINEDASVLQVSDVAHIEISDDEGFPILDKDINLYNYGKNYLEIDCEEIRVSPQERYYVTFDLSGLSDGSYLVVRSHQARTFDDAMQYVAGDSELADWDSEQLVGADDSKIADELSLDMSFGYNSVVSVAYYYSSLNLVRVFVYLAVFSLICVGLFFPKILSNSVILGVYRFFVTPLFIYLLGNVLNIEKKGVLNFLFPLNLKHLFGFALSLFIIAVLCFFFYMITGSYSSGALITLLIAGVIGYVNHAKIVMRGDSFMPWDIFSAGIAAKIGSTYYFRLTVQFFAGIVLVLIVLIIIRFSSGSAYRISKERIAMLALSVTLMVLLVVGGVLNTNLLDKIGVYYGVYPPIQSYNENGTYLAFLLHLNNLTAEGKEENSPKATADTIFEYEVVIRRDRIYEREATEDIKPNVICIMSEAYSNISDFQDIETSEPVTPFMDTLREQSMYGNMAVSVFGGGTCNTEFEFLTGFSVSSLLPGSSVYTLYVNDEVDSALPMLFRENGYRTVALHPFDAQWWDRESRYPYLGFDEFYSRDDFDPSTTSYVRNYISDMSCFHELTDIFESSSDPLFLFCVTMQNHADYSTRYDNMAYDIHLTDMVDDNGEPYVYAENYLSLLRESDDALQYLITYLSESSEPTIVVFFGDHRPTFNDTFYDDVLGCDLGTVTLDESINLYETPYVIWANYDLSTSGTSIDTSPGNQGITSPNFLGQTVLDLAGIDSPDSRACLRVLQNEIMAISSIAVYDETGEAHPDFSELPEPIQEIISDYTFIEYGLLYFNDDTSAEMVTDES